MRFLAVCIANRYKPLEYDELPYYCYVHEPVYFPRNKTKDRIEFLVKWWNEAHLKALEFYPDATHIVHLGTYYLPQVLAIRALVREYERRDDPNIILAGTVWGKTPLLPYLKMYNFYDTWGYPELAGLRYFLRPPKGFLQLSTVAVPMIYPVSVWKEHPFHNSEDLKNLWYATFCQESGLPIFSALGVRFFRSKYDSEIPDYQWWKQLRISLALGTRIRKLRKNDSPR